MIQWNNEGRSKCLISCCVRYFQLLCDHFVTKAIQRENQPAGMPQEKQQVETERSTITPLMSVSERPSITPLMSVEMKETDTGESPMDVEPWLSSTTKSDESPPWLSKRASSEQGEGGTGDSFLGLDRTTHHLVMVIYLLQNSRSLDSSCMVCFRDQLRVFIHFNYGV